MISWPRKILWGVLALAVLGCIGVDLFPRRQAPSRLGHIPLKGLGFNGKDLPLTPAENSVYNRASVLKRIYQAGPSQFVLIAIDGSNDRHAIHDPLYCFRGAGWSVTGENSTPLPGGYGMRVRLARGKETAEALYWITDGEHRHASAMKAWWGSVTQRLTPSRPARAPVLMVLQPVIGTSVNWEDLLNRFTELSTI